jgi:type II secretory pathway predicted ATPase ExeA
MTLATVSLHYAKKPTSLLGLPPALPQPSATSPLADTLTYEPFFGLNEKPFSLDSDPRFIYDSPTHQATRKNLLAGIRRREGLLVLTGEIGTGKTTLCRTVLRDLGRNTLSSLIPDPFAAREDLLKMLLVDFGVMSIEELTDGRLRQASRTELGYLLSQFLNTLSHDAFAVVIIDEAQNLTVPLIEETRILFDTFGAKGRLQIMFVGQPELHAKLKLPEMRQVDQRVCGYHRLAAMNGEAVAGYIAHRLRVAGARLDHALFPPAVIDSLHRRTGGVPRLINRVCDRALHLAHERQAIAVNQDILDAALLELGSVTLSPTWDAIIFGEQAAPAAAVPVARATQPAPSAGTAPAAAPVVTPAPAAAPAARPARPARQATRDTEDFQKEINDWVAQDLPAASAKNSALFAGLEDAPQERRATTPKPVQRRASSTRSMRTDWPRDVRSETYIQKFMRIWMRRALIALAAFVAVNIAVAVASNALRILEPPALPAVPAAPAKVLPAIALPESTTEVVSSQ